MHHSRLLSHLFFPHPTPHSLARAPRRFYRSLASDLGFAAAGRHSPVCLRRKRLPGPYPSSHSTSTDQERLDGRLFRFSFLSLLAIHRP
uniref:Uncharacterized protein n=1 Tax=Triticum urartu TaxID=4572 RepID=A0A8R7TVT0_TRIUA